MKYIRKGIALILIVVFIAAVAVGLGVIFAVRNVNICAISYTTEEGGGSDEFTQAVASITDALSSLKGKSMIGIDDDDVASAVGESGYVELVSVEKVYPCTLNITIKERFEVYAVASEDSSLYSVYDASFSYITSKSSNVNNLDGAANVLVSDIAEEDYEYVMLVAGVLEENLASLRVIAEEFSCYVYSGSSSDADTDVLTVTMRCGLTLELYAYRENTVEKAEFLCEVFTELDEDLKLGGTMKCMSSLSGDLVVIKPDNSFAYKE